MKRARQRNHSFSSRRGAGKFDRTLHRFGAGVAKENRVEMRRGALGDRFREQTAEQRAIHLHHVWQIEIKHVADRFFHQRMVASDVENTVAAQKIEIRRVIHVVEISAFSAGIDLVEADDPLRLHQRAIQMLLVQIVIFAQTRGDDLFQIESHIEAQNLRDLRVPRNWRIGRSAGDAKIYVGFADAANQDRFRRQTTVCPRNGDLFTTSMQHFAAVY